MPRHGRRAVGIALAVSLALASPAAAARDDEAALRRRVQRFYALSYLNRHGELWEMFSTDLRARLGDDRAEYVRSARGSGFELYGSRLETVELGGDRALVEVSVEVQLPGALDITRRRHRMLWTRVDGRWRYAGSMDITHAPDAEVETGELQPPGRAPAPTVTVGEELLPARRPAGARRAPATEARPAAGAERWDLVAVPPPGTTPPAPVDAEPVVLPPAAAPGGEPAPEAAAPERVASNEPAGAGSGGPEVAALLPPERLASAPAAPAAVVGQAAHPTTDVAMLVRRAVEGSPFRRQRALERLRRSRSEAVVDLMAEALPRAPRVTALSFLERLAGSGGSRHAAAVAGLVASEHLEVRRAALDTLGRLGSREHVALVLARLVAEPQAFVRVGGLRALGRLGGSEAAGVLATTLADPVATADELAAAAWAAGACACLPDTALLRRHVGESSRDAVVLAVIEALGRLGTGEAMVTLHELEASDRVLRPGVDPVPVRLAALRALAATGEEGAGPRLAEELLALGLRATAADVDRVALGGETTGLSRLLAHPHPVIRARSADFLGRFIEEGRTGEDVRGALDEAFLAEGDQSVLLRLREARSRLDESRKTETADSP